MNAQDIRHAMREGQLQRQTATFILDTLPGQLDGELERRGFALVSATAVRPGVSGETRLCGTLRVPAAPHGTTDTLEFNLGVTHTDMLRVQDARLGNRSVPFSVGLPGSDPVKLASDLLDLLLRCWADDLRRGGELQRSS